MRFHESHFWYNKSQRNGILILASLLTLLQVVIYFADELFAPEQNTENLEELRTIQKQLDSLAKDRRNSKTFEIYPFNPNYLSDYKGYILGMSPQEIDRLLQFREQGKFLRSSKEFQQVTGVSDSLMSLIAVHFRFPEQKKFPRENKNVPKGQKNSPGARAIKRDLNAASAEELMIVRGIGPVLAKRIIAYRSHLMGFSFDDQLHEVYNLPEDALDNLLDQFEVKVLPTIEKINVNTASFRQILDLPYIDYDLTRKIIDFRNEEKVITDLADLKQIDSFPLDKYDRIAVYLLAE